MKKSLLVLISTLLVVMVLFSICACTVVREEGDDSGNKDENGNSNTPVLPPEGLTLEMNTDKTGYWITKADESIVKGDFNIPAQFDGLPILGIKSKAFFECNNLISVTISDGIKYISSSAFENCDNLKTVNLPNSLESIGRRAFADCTAIEAMDIPSSVTELEELVLAGCTSLQSLSLPSLSVYEQGEIMSCRLSEIVDSKNLKELQIKGGEVIVNEAFKGFEKLETIQLASTIKKIGRLAFQNCYSLKNIVIPQNVTNISSSLFYNCTALENLVIPEGVTSIEDNAFEGCSSLKEVQLPSSLNNIGFMVFVGCYNLQKVVYTGTIDDFQMITKSSNWGGIRKDQSVTVSCTNGEIDIHEV